MNTYVQPDSLDLGVEFDSLQPGPPPFLRISWIRWDSPCRGSGLRVGDRVIAVGFNGRSLDLAQFSRALVPGQYWKEAGARDGDPVTLTVRRRVVPGRGWAEIAVRVHLASQVSYRDDQGQIYYGTGGPQQWEQDGYPQSWSSWYETVIKQWGRILDESWTSPSFVTSDELGQHQLLAERVQRLQEKYPGPFASAVRDDYAAVREYLLGRAYTLAADALAYRQIGEQTAREVAEAGQAARAAFLAAHASELLPSLPEIDPILGDRSKVAGKLVEMPLATNQEWISQGPRTYFVFNQGNGWFFAGAESPAAQYVLDARFRYEQQVMPNVRSEFRFIARILNTPSLIVVGGQGRFGLLVEPVAATIGDAFFVEVPQARGAVGHFAGEDRLQLHRPTPPADGAPPEAVLMAFFSALKAGDEALWRSLYAPFEVWFADDGTPRIEPDTGHGQGLDWNDARRHILDDVCDVRVVWIGDERTIVKGTEFPGAPRIDEVTIDVDHVRRDADGGFRSFDRVGLQRLWTLQRMGGGPWRIVTAHGI